MELSTDVVGGCIEEAARGGKDKNVGWIRDSNGITSDVRKDEVCGFVSSSIRTSSLLKVRSTEIESLNCNRYGLMKRKLHHFPPRLRARLPPLLGPDLVQAASHTHPSKSPEQVVWSSVCLLAAQVLFRAQIYDRTQVYSWEKVFRPSVRNSIEWREVVPETYRGVGVYTSCSANSWADAAASGKFIDVIMGCSSGKAMSLLISIAKAGDSEGIGQIFRKMPERLSRFNSLMGWLGSK